MNAVLWFLVLAGGAAIGAVYSDAGGIDMALVAVAVALLFVFVALLIRLVMWTIAKASYPGQWFYDKREAILTVVVLVLLLVAAIPAYRDYRVRKAVDETLAAIAPARRIIENHFAGNRIFPPSLEQVALKSLLYDKTSGALTVVFDREPIEGKSVVVTPVPTGFGALSWTCRTVDVPTRYLPTSCR
jgi:type IV pilus assembly protein PilA